MIYPDSYKCFGSSAFPFYIYTLLKCRSFKGYYSCIFLFNGIHEGFAQGKLIKIILGGSYGADPVFCILFQ
jgi:hypothetical protein